VTGCKKLFEAQQRTNPAQLRAEGRVDGGRLNQHPTPFPCLLNPHIRNATHRLLLAAPPHLIHAI